MLQMKSSNVGGRAIRKSHIVWSCVTNSTVFGADTTRTKRSCDHERIGGRRYQPTAKAPADMNRHHLKAPATKMTGSTHKTKKGPAASMMGWVRVRRQHTKTRRRTSGWALSQNMKRTCGHGDVCSTPATPAEPCNIARNVHAVVPHAPPPIGPRNATIIPIYVHTDASRPGWPMCIMYGYHVTSMGWVDTKTHHHARAM